MKKFSVALTFTFRSLAHLQLPSACGEKSGSRVFPKGGWPVAPAPLVEVTLLFSLCCFGALVINRTRKKEPVSQLFSVPRVCLAVPVSHCLDSCSFAVILRIFQFSYSSPITLDSLSPLNFHTNLRIGLSIPILKKNNS